MKTAYLVLGNQLMRNHPALEANAEDLVVMIEAHDLCAKMPYHKHKLVLILAAMRNYRDHIQSKGIKVAYTEITESNIFATDLEETIKINKITHLKWMRTSDKTPHTRLMQMCDRLGITYEVHPNQQFITSPSSFDEWYDSQKQPLMESFYRWQRKRTSILMQSGKPVGGAWNYDAENRKPLPKKPVTIPPLPSLKHDKNVQAVIALVEKLFDTNPGDASLFWLPTDFEAADTWLESFINTKLVQFGDYEDASKEGEPFLFHSVLSPLLNCGLLSPDTAVKAVLQAYNNGSAPLNAAEGFVRQIIGWREYMHGMYMRMPELMNANYFGFTKELEAWWYDETYQDQNLPIPVKAALKTVHTYGYNHHIERLMVLGNWFLLNEYSPQSVYKWFSSMYVDAYQWVMVPNVQGMSQYADGGIIATKPYISGGNYLQKMGNWWPSLQAAKDSDYNVLYWKFLINHHDMLKDNFRMSIALKQARSIRDKAA